MEEYLVFPDWGFGSGVLGKEVNIRDNSGYSTYRGY